MEKTPRFKADPFSAPSLRVLTFEGVGTFSVPGTINRKSANRHGWQVKGTTPSKFFADDDHGGAGESLAAASEHLRLHRSACVKPRARSAIVPWSPEACRRHYVGRTLCAVPQYIYRDAGTKVAQKDGTRREVGGFWRLRFNPPFSNFHDADHGNDPTVSLAAAVAALKAQYVPDTIRIAKVSLATQEPWSAEALKSYVVEGVGTLKVPRFIQRIRRPNNRDGWQLRYGETTRFLTDRDNGGTMQALSTATELLKSVWQADAPKAGRDEIPPLNQLFQ